MVWNRIPQSKRLVEISHFVEWDIALAQFTGILVHYFESVQKHHVCDISCFRSGINLSPETVANQFAKSPDMIHVGMGDKKTVNRFDVIRKGLFVLQICFQSALK